MFFLKADKRPALNAASSHGRFEVAEYLLDQGANVNAEDGVSFEKEVKNHTQCW